MRQVARDRMDRAREKASLGHPAGRVAVELLEPDRGPVPNLSYQGEPPAVEYRTLPEKVGLALVIVFCAVIGVVFAIALAVTIIEVVAWWLSG